MQQKYDARKAILTPVVMTLKSRRFIVAMGTLLVGVLITQVSDLRAVRGELLTLVITLGLALIGGYTIEDSVTAGRDRAGAPETPLSDTIKEVLLTLVDELGLQREDPEHLADVRRATTLLNEAAAQYIAAKTPSLPPTTPPPVKDDYTTSAQG